MTDLRSWGSGGHSRRLWLAVAMIATLTPGTAGAQSPPQSCGDARNGISLQVEISDIRAASGTISIAVYGDRPEDFLAKGKKLRKLRLPAHKGVVQGCISLPGPGTYAIAAYHDEDGDRHLTRNMLGLPTEGLAVSNDPALLFGIPAFADAAFSVAGDQRIQLRMTYR